MVQKISAQGVSVRQACELIGTARSSYLYQGQDERPEDHEAMKRILELARRHPRYGYRRITALLRREGRRINAKRVFRTWQDKGLCLPRRRPRRVRFHEMWERPQEATRPNDVWSYDFVFDRTLTGRTLKMLVVVDEYTRECLAIHVRFGLCSLDVKEVLQKVIRRRGKPRFIRSDNGSEFIAAYVRGWLLSQGIRPLYIDPGSPWQNGYVESLNGKLRDECLNCELFWSAREAQAVIHSWVREYNGYRRHSSLGYRTPAEVGRGVDDSLDSGVRNTFLRASRN